MHILPLASFVNELSIEREHLRDFLKAGAPNDLHCAWLPREAMFSCWPREIDTHIYPNTILQSAVDHVGDYWPLSYVRKVLSSELIRIDN